MGRKGTSKRKPKQSNSSSKDKNNNPSSSRPGEGTVVQNLVKDNGSALIKGKANPSSGTGGKNNKTNGMH